jgi:RNA-binding protein
MLTPKQRQFLKAQAHHLKPVVHVGKLGVSPTFLAELDFMLDSQSGAHENQAEPECWRRY